MLGSPANDTVVVPSVKESMYFVPMIWTSVRSAGGGWLIAVPVGCALLVADVLASIESVLVVAEGSDVGTVLVGAETVVSFVDCVVVVSLVLAFASALVVGDVVSGGVAVVVAVDSACVVLASTCARAGFTTVSPTANTITTTPNP
jgi:hypothetical protein